ncbi:hypothetical protein DFP83_10569 [Idiomarina fontislapidosi]|uniref:Uncharacterized protein n=1 Tax=Idiomarina fontislapidosi TaxID=263723 RepID=A0A432XYM4_9GAMM|nr:hypothetical protein [Idiomarina fontislapidosi]PYE32762.1 hypothetical protein DFP83_10569 [Idiomarina fontislapidosi]RUO53797.1 hypothetical protein CWE25_07865 [Idiomarina fontislapidosi]
MTKVFEAKLAKLREHITQLLTSDEAPVEDLEKHINIYYKQLPFYTEEVLETNGQEEAAQILSKEIKFVEVLKGQLDELKDERKLALLGLAKGKKARRKY